MPVPKLTKLEFKIMEPELCTEAIWQPLGILFYNSRDARLRASRIDSQESPKW